MIITIDGTAGTGKTTVARSVAQRLGIPYFDTGAMYRAVAWALLKEGISLDHLEDVSHLLDQFTFDIRIVEGESHYFVGEVDVTAELRTQKINDIVSAVAALPKVREVLWMMQRAYAQRGSAVFEGRDMGSVVFPQADVKIFLSASPKVRAQRRLKEMQTKLPAEAQNWDEKTMEKELKRRDAHDKGRTLAPLQCPKGAYRIDTSHLTIEEVIEKIIAYHSRRAQLKVPAWLHAKKMGLLYRMVLCMHWTLFKLFYRHKVYGLEHYVNQAAIIAPNHTSYLDPPLASISWPAEVHFLAKESLFGPFLFGRFIRALNAHPVRGDVTDLGVFKTILQLLSEGKQVVIFPEGGRTSGEFGEIKPGIGMLVLRAKAAVIPTYIHGTSTIWGRNRKWPKLYGRTACVFGSPIFWDSVAHLEKREAQVVIAQRMMAKMRELKAWYEAGAQGIPP